MSFIQRPGDWSRLITKNQRNIITRTNLEAELFRQKYKYYKWTGYSLKENVPAFLLAHQPASKSRHGGLLLVMNAQL